MKKKLLSLGALGFISIALVSCSSSVNTTVAYGSLSDTTIYASSNGNSISEKKLYDLMRSDAYTTIKTNIKEQLFSDVLPVYDKTTKTLSNTTYFQYDPDSTDADVLEDTYSINTSVVSKIYGVSTVDDFKALTEKDKTTALTKAVDTLYKEGVRKDDGSAYTKSDLESFTIDFTLDEYGNDVFYAKFDYQLYKSYVYNKATERYALAQLKNPDFKYYYKNKYVSGHGTNSFYVEDEDVSNFYYSTGKYYRDYRGIIIKFTSQAAAERIMQSAIGSTTISSDPTTALNEYIKIYNQRYATREDLTLSTVSTDRYTNLSVSNKKSNLSSYDSNVQNIFKDEMEDNEYLNKAFNLNGSYYLIYRISGEEVVEWANLSDSDKDPNIADNIYNEMLEYCLKTKSLSSLVTLIENERFDEIVDNDAIDFYDPVFAVKFESDYDDYSLTKTSNNDYVYKFTFDGKDYSLTPEELYEKIEPIYGSDTAIDYLKDEWLLSLDDVVSLIDSDVFDDAADDLNSELKKFRKGKKSYSSKIGTAAYLQLTYGMSTKAEVLRSKKADTIESRLSSFYGDFSNADNETFNTEATLFKNFTSIYQSIYDNYFSADISHILIGVDVDGTGTYTNPSVYYDSLPTDALKEKYNQSLLDLVNAIISEVNILTTSKSVKDSLTYIVEAYENNYLIGSLSYDAGYEIYWNDLKNEFPFALKAEDLSTVDLFAAANYMEEFSDRVKELYDKVSDDIINEEDVEDKGVFEYSSTFADSDAMLDSLCTTSYGYHILNIYGINEAKTALFKASSDTKEDDSDEYSQYEHLKVIIIPDDANGSEDDDDDPEYVLYTNGYSETDYASISQLFIYFYESVVVGSHSLLKSSVKTAISTMFDSALSFFTNSTFQKWIILKYKLSDLTFQNSDQYDMYIKNIENSLYSYSTSKYTMYRDYIDGTYDWTIDYSWNH